MTFSLLRACLHLLQHQLTRFGAHVALPPLTAFPGVGSWHCRARGWAHLCGVSALTWLCLMPTGPPQQQVAAGEDSK